MTSPDIASSIEDPSPTMPELVHDALGLQLEGRFGYGAPNPAVDTFQTVSGAIILKRLLPQFSNDSIFLLRDAITLQHEVIETMTGSLNVRPTSLFSGWIQKLRGKTQELQPATASNPLERVDIIDEITGHTRQMHAKTYPESHAIVVRETSVSGGFSIDDEYVQFDPEKTVIEVGRLSYDPGDYQGRISTKGRRYYTYLPTENTVYRSKQFGGTIDDTPVKNARLHNRTIDDMSAVLEEIQTAGNIIQW